MTAAPSASPSPEFRRHHRVVDPEISARRFHPAWRVNTRLDQLLLEEAISPAAWSAAIAYRYCHARANGPGLASNLDLIGTGRRPGRSGTVRLEYSEAQLAATQRLTRTRAALGTILARLIEACVVNDQSWAEIARPRQISPKTGKVWVIAALKRLAQIW